MARSRELAGRLHNLMADPDGGFWLATSTGLAHHVPTLWSTPRELASFTRPASTIFQARNGDLFIQHDNELLHRHEGHWRAFRLPLGHEGGLVRTDAMAEMPDGRILLGGRPTPAMFFDRERGTFAPLVHPRGWFVEVLNRARGGGAWVLTTETESQRRHLERFDGTHFEDVATGSDRWRTLPPRAVVDLADGGWIVVPDGDGYGEGRGHALRTRRRRGWRADVADRGARGVAGPPVVRLARRSLRARRRQLAAAALGAAVGAVDRARPRRHGLGRLGLRRAPFA